MTELSLVDTVLFGEQSIKFRWQTEERYQIGSRFFAMPQESHPGTYSIPTQWGCEVDCEFCHTGPGNGVQNLSTEVMVDQIRGAVDYFVEEGRADEVENFQLGFLGSGEPMHNLGNVLAVKKEMADDLEQRISKYILSTSGWAPGINVVTHRDPTYRLGISLHAGDDETRSQFIPSTNTFGVRQIVDAAANYYDESGLPVTVNYTLIDGLNNTKSDASRLVNLLDAEKFVVNLQHLIEPQTERFEPVSVSDLKQFNDWLRDGGLETRIAKNEGCPV